MSGRWGGDIKGRRQSTSERKRRDQDKPPRQDERLRAGTIIAATGFYLLTLAGAALCLA